VVLQLFNPFCQKNVACSAHEKTPYYQQSSGSQVKPLKKFMCVLVFSSP
jgi:hypothetical protein